MHNPLAELLRPTTLCDVVGQDHLIGPAGVLSKIILNGKPLSIVLWGPPGSGKTTLARLYAQAFSLQCTYLSAVHGGVSEIKRLIHALEERPLFHTQQLLFIDEIHRFNKAQQDLFLPFLEKGAFTLIGATTENPSFALNDALLSRLRVLQVKSLKENDLEKILQRFEKQKAPLPITARARAQLIAFSQGDGRHLLNMVENIVYSAPTAPLDELSDLIQRKSGLYDAHGEGHFNLISALHKSIRASDPQAALYYLARMLNAGEDPQFIARRLVRAATEDVGLADPQALQAALGAWKAFDQLGAPEGELALAQATLYLALSPKSNAVYTAWDKAKEAAANSAHLAPPAPLLNAPTPLMKELGYGKEYVYDHDCEGGHSGQACFPPEMQPLTFYEPKAYGFEKELKARIEYFAKLRKAHKP